MSVEASTRVSCYGVGVHHDRWIAIHQSDIKTKTDCEVSWIFGALKELYFEEPVSVVPGSEYTVLVVPPSVRDKVVGMLMKACFGEGIAGEIHAQFKPVLASKREGDIVDMINEYAGSYFVSVIQKLTETTYSLALKFDLKMRSFLSNFENFQRVYELRHSMYFLDQETRKMLYRCVFRILKDNRFFSDPRIYYCASKHLTITDTFQELTQETRTKLLEIAELLPFKKRIVQLFKSEVWNRYQGIINSKKPYQTEWLICPLKYLTIGFEDGTDIPLPRSGKDKSQVPGPIKPINLSKLKSEFNYFKCIGTNTHDWYSRQIYPSEQVGWQVELQVLHIEEKIRTIVKQYPELREELPPWFPFETESAGGSCVFS